MGRENLSFFAAMEPVIDADSVDFKNTAVNGSDTDIRISMNKNEFENLFDTLIHLPKFENKQFAETLRFLKQHPPIEDIASKGANALRAELSRYTAPPRTAYAVITLNRDKLKPQMLFLRGFASNLRLGAQQRFIRLIPGLENANILRYAHIHKNTFINSPKILNTSLQSREHTNIFFAGQIAGTDGYIEAIATGLLAGKNAARFFNNQPPLPLAKNSMLGALTAYISFAGHDFFQPVGAHAGLL